MACSGLSDTLHNDNCHASVLGNLEHTVHHLRQQKHTNLHAIKRKTKKHSGAIGRQFCFCGLRPETFFSAGLPGLTETATAFSSFLIGWEIREKGGVGMNKPMRMHLSGLPLANYTLVSP